MALIATLCYIENSLNPLVIPCVFHGSSRKLSLLTYLCISDTFIIVENGIVYIR
jgi:hypothetical protein